MEPVSSGSAQRISDESQQVCLSESSTAALSTLAREQGLTLNTLVLGAWAILLSRYSGESDVVLGATVSGRPAELSGVENMVGLFINTLPVRIKLSPDSRLAPWLGSVQAELAELRQYEYCGLVDIQGWSDVPRGLPLFRTILVFENYPMRVSAERLRESEFHIEAADLRVTEMTHYPLFARVIPGRELELRVGYDSTLYDAAAAGRILRCFKNVLEAMAANIHNRLSCIEVLNESERHQALVENNDTRRDYEKGSIHKQVELQSERTPDAVAVEFEQEQVTYRELNVRSNQVGWYLRSLGVGLEILVGLCIERSIEMIVGLLGVLKSGGAYLPLDPHYPKERLSFMITDSPVEMVLTQDRLRAKLAPLSDHVLFLDSDWHLFASTRSDNPDHRVFNDSAAYVIYTSGSTGRPKAAVNTQGAIWNRLLWMQEALGLGPSDRVLQKTPFSFDVSVWELFWPLVTGARLVMASPEGHKDPAYLVRTINTQEITTVHFVPAMLAAFVEEEGLVECRSLRLIISSGEELTPNLVGRFYERVPDVEMYNLYGPTETAVDVTVWRCVNNPGRQVVPIGRPIANTQMYVLDEAMAPAPLGVRGELYIGGNGVGRGYLGRAGMT
ncbi:MAG: non-ribosomal peptide synthetase, partial [Blastocatellia bacterium]